MTKHRVRGVYGGAWGKLVAGDYKPNQATLRKLGRALVDHIVKEAQKDFNAQPEPARGRPEGLPDSKKFYESFSFRVKGSTVEILSNWPTIDPILEGRDPYPMTWLTQDKGVGIVPLIDPTNKVIFRMAPANSAEAWIHPGFEKHNFMRRGVEKARAQMADLIKQDLAAFIRGKT
jgi:hypothetical protein